MITDLGRRNQARMCGSLGIEHIVISAHIKKKREHIRKNVEAWLKKPDLGTIPLFMAGDKQYFYYANKLKKQLGLDSIFLCINPLEKTDFKTGFCNIKPQNKKSLFYRIAFLDKIKLAIYYGKQFFKNPAFLNSSLLDTIGAYLSYYVISHNYINLFQYIKWDESEVDSVLINQYKWETASNIKSTWRIGDGTAPFYNYIYYTVAGFTENDTFRSNQIREGQITREEALQKAYEENKPRFSSIKWYCDTICVNFEEAISKINAITKLYKMQ